MNEPTDRPPLDLRRPRDVGALISDGWNVYSRNLRVLLGLGAAVIIPVELIVLGLGLGWFTADYNTFEEISTGEQVVVGLAELLVIVPLVMAMAVYVLQDVAAGEKPTFRGTAQRAFDIFTPVMTVVVMVGVLALCGVALLILPGIFIAIALVFAPIVAVAEQSRGPDALRRSWELVRGFWWRTFGVVVIIYLAGQLMASVTLIGFVRGAEAADSAAIALAGQVVSSAIFTPFLSVVFALFYFDQKVRSAGRA